MRIAAISDIHGNLPALEAVLAEIDTLDVDLIVVCGDIAAGPMPAPTIDRLRSLDRPARFVRGNADRYIVEVPNVEAPDERLVWIATQLNASRLGFLRGFEDTVEVDVDGLGKVTFCHAAPASDEVPLVTAESPDAVVAEALAQTDAGVIVAGHMHHQFDRTVDGGRFVNAGSVGMPYADQPGAYWTLVGPDVEPRRTPYDYAATAAAIRATDFSDREEFAANVVQPDSAASKIDLFERIAGRR
jgi:putative phosphoesterase